MDLGKPEGVAITIWSMSISTKIEDWSFGRTGEGKQFVADKYGGLILVLVQRILLPLAEVLLHGPRRRRGEALLKIMRVGSRKDT